MVTGHVLKTVFLYYLKPSNKIFITNIKGKDAFLQISYIWHQVPRKIFLNVIFMIYAF